MSRFYLMTSNKMVHKTEQKSPMEVDKFFNFKRKATALPLRDLGNIDQYITPEDKEKLAPAYQYAGSYSKVAILVDAGTKKFVEKREMTSHLQHLGTLNIVEYEGRYYIQKVGLPQGLNISGVMSSFYYASLEEEALNFLKAEEESGENIHMIMRLTDDYLIVTNSKDNATRMIENLVKLSKKYDFQFNMKKLTTNFFYSSGLNENDVVTSQNFTSTIAKWIGKVINLSNMEIHPVMNLEYDSKIWEIVRKLTLF